jgi:hypothetical protein
VEENAHCLAKNTEAKSWYVSQAADHSAKHRATIQASDFSPPEISSDNDSILKRDWRRVDNRNQANPHQDISTNKSRSKYALDPELLNKKIDLRPCYLSSDNEDHTDPRNRPRERSVTRTNHRVPTSTPRDQNTSSRLALFDRNRDSTPTRQSNNPKRDEPANTSSQRKVSENFYRESSRERPLSRGRSESRERYENIRVSRQQDTSTSNRDWKSNVR